MSRSSESGSRWGTDSDPPGPPPTTHNSNPWGFVGIWDMVKFTTAETMAENQACSHCVHPHPAHPPLPPAARQPVSPAREGTKITMKQVREKRWCIICYQTSRRLGHAKVGYCSYV